MRTILVRAFFIVYILMNRIGETSRFLPMIVWDHMNPMLSCKCNWFNIPKMDIYDEMNMMCPTLKVTAKLLDGFSRPTEQMNENIFRRTWKGQNLSELKQQLDDGSFCDPSHKDTVKLFTCKNGNEGSALFVKFTKSRKFNAGDIVVFFNNGDDGEAATLNSKKKHCASVFIVNITREVKQPHDLSYGKCLDDQAQHCNDANIKCGRACQREPSNYSAPTVAPARVSTTTTKKRTTTMEETPTVTEEMLRSPVTTVSSKTPEFYQRDESMCKEFSMKFLVIGLVAGLGLSCGVFVLFIFIMKMKRKRHSRPKPVLT